MNPYDEQETKIYIELGNQLAEAKLKKLYTWHDIDAVKEQSNETVTNVKSDLERCAKYLFLVGIGVGFMLATLLLHLIK